MSRRIVGYEGEGRHRRPIYSEPLTDDLRSSPPGPVERRLATAEERDGFAPRVVAPGLVRLPPREAEPIQLEEVATERVLAVITGPTVSARTIEEERVMEAAAAATETIDEVPPETLGDTLAVLIDATHTAEAAWRRQEEIQRKHADLTALLEEAEAEWRGARAALEASWGATWLGFYGRALPDDVLPPIDDPVSAAERRHERLLHGELADIERSLDGVAVTTTLTETDGPADGASGTRTRRAAEGGPDRPEARPLTARQEKVLALLEANGGDRAAAARELGVVYQSVDEILEAVAKKGLLPIGLIAKLPARFAKYSVVGR